MSGIRNQEEYHFLDFLIFQNIFYILGIAVNNGPVRKRATFCNEWQTEIKSITGPSCTATVKRLMIKKHVRKKSGILGTNGKSLYVVQPKKSYKPCQTNLVKEHKWKSIYSLQCNKKKDL